MAERQRDGDADHLDEIEYIWKEHRTELRRFIQRRVGSASAADDLLQDVFLRVHSHIGTLNDTGKTRSWIYQIARNVVTDHHRTRRTWEGLPETLVAPEPDPADEARREIGACITSVSQGLPEHYRQAVTLSDVEGLTQKEIAARQGLSLSGAKSRVQRGRALVRRKLLAHCRFEYDHRGNVISHELNGTACGIC